MNRRDFLTSSAMIGTVASLLTPLMKGPSGWFAPAGTPAASPVSKVQIVRADMAAAEAFERGVRGALESLGVPPGQIGASLEVDFDRLKAHLTETPGAVLIGLLSESDAIVLTEVVRESGARLLLQGTHMAGDEAHSRHALSTTAASAGLGTVFAQWLKQQQQHGLVQETAMRASSQALPRPKPLTSSAESWPEWLGQAAAQVATGRWLPSAVASRTRVGAGDAFASASAGYVSFVCVS